jgi:two-component sensor histidine kinase
LDDGEAHAKVQGRSGATVRRRLQLMSLSLLAPTVVFMALLIGAQYQASRRLFEDQLIATTRILGVSAERELEHSRGVLAGLALSPALQAGDFAAFDAQARAASRQGQGWIVLLGEDQRQIVNTLVPPGRPLAQGGFPQAAWAELRAGRGRVSGLTPGALLKRPIIAVDRPILIKGRLFVLSYIQEPAVFQSIFVPNLLPRSWIGVILDQNHRIIARSVAPEHSLGLRGTEDVRQAILRRPEGILLSRSLEGAPTVLGYSRSPDTGWAFLIAAPRRELQWAALRSVWTAAAGVSLLLVAGLLSARWFAQPISRDIAALASQAGALGRRRPQVELGGAFAETAQVRAALSAAAEALALRETEQGEAHARQRTLINELNHRVKNTLATVQSLARQSFAGAAARQDVRAFEERLIALSQAHDLLTANAWSGADLRGVAAQTLAPYGERATWSGPTLALGPQAAVSLSLVLHEMATNAAKYGAFSSDGRVELDWRLSTEGDRVILTWSERDGPPVERPTAPGFGSRLIRQTVERELGGVFTPDFRRAGLHCVFDLPLSDRLVARDEPEAA